MLRPRLHFVSTMRRNCQTRARRGRRTERRKSGSRSNENSPGAVCRTVTAYIYVTYLWCTRTFGVNLMSEKLPHHRLFPLSSSLSFSLNLFLLSPSSPRIPAMFDSFYRGPSTYLSLTSHEKYIRDSSVLFSRFRLSGFQLLVSHFSGGSLMYWTKRAAIGRWLCSARYRPSFFPFLASLKNQGI